MKGKLKEFLEKAGANNLVNTAVNLAKNSNIPILSQVAGITGMIIDSKELTPEQKEEALKIKQLEFEDKADDRKNISDRWRTDMTSDNKLSKNVRPIILLTSWAFMIILGLIITLTDKETPDQFLYAFSGAWGLVNTAYFGDRAIRGIMTIKNKFKK